MRLAEAEKYRHAINLIKKNIAYMSIELKKTRGRKYNLMNESQMKLIMIIHFSR